MECANLKNCRKWMKPDQRPVCVNGSMFVKAGDGPEDVPEECFSHMA